MPSKAAGHLNFDHIFLRRILVENNIFTTNAYWKHFQRKIIKTKQLGNAVHSSHLVGDNGGHRVHGASCFCKKWFFPSGKKTSKKTEWVERVCTERKRKGKGKGVTNLNH